MSIYDKIDHQLDVNICLSCPGAIECEACDIGTMREALDRITVCGECIYYIPFKLDGASKGECGNPDGLSCYPLRPNAFCPYGNRKRRW